jgi:hypothetical protein
MRCIEDADMAESPPETEPTAELLKRKGVEIYREAGKRALVVVEEADAEINADNRIAYIWNFSLFSVLISFWFC